MMEEEPAPAAAPASAPATASDAPFSLTKVLCGGAPLLLTGSLALAACLALLAARQHGLIGIAELCLACAAAALALAPYALDAAGLAPGALALVLRASSRARAPRGALLRSLPAGASRPSAAAASAASAAAAAASAAAAAAAPAALAAAAAQGRRLAAGARVRLAGRGLEGTLVADDGPAHRLPYLVDADCGGLHLCGAEELAVLQAPLGLALAVGDRVAARGSSGAAGGGGAGRVVRVAHQGPLAPAQRYLVQDEASGAWAWRAAAELVLA
jgi:hypothetical protein